MSYNFALQFSCKETLQQTFFQFGFSQKPVCLRTILWGLRGNVRVLYLRLVERPVVDFLIPIIELCSLGVMAHNVTNNGTSPTNHSSC